MQVAVIGAGVMGLATGWALKRRGHEPVVYEQFEVGNPHGSSHGRSRIFRLAYAEDHYVRLAQESLALWRELEAETGETVLELHGLVEIVRTLEESTAAHARALRRRLGAARPRGGRAPLPDPRARRLVRASSSPRPGSRAPTRRSPRFRRELDVREGTRVTPDEVDADVVVVTAGSWVNELLDEPLPVKTTRETVCYFRPDAAAGRSRRSSRSSPTGTRTTCTRSTTPVYGLKVGAHHAGQEADPERAGRARAPS